MDLKKNDVMNLPYWQRMQTCVFVDSTTTYYQSES